jgi:hypothetical protein
VLRRPVYIDRRVRGAGLRGLPGWSSSADLAGRLGVASFACKVSRHERIRNLRDLVILYLTNYYSFLGNTNYYS